MTGRTALGTALLAISLAMAPAAAATAKQPKKKAKGSSLQVTIKRTSFGIPHIKSKTWKGLGYGYGYATAQDVVCVLADTYVTVRAERSKYFGPDKSYPFRANGTNPNNLNSDLFYQRIIDKKTVERLRDAPPPDGPVAEGRELISGYVAGYNAYLKRTGVDKLPDPTCRGKDWVKPIEEIDAYRRFYQLALLASQGVAIDGITTATPLVGLGPTLAEQTALAQALSERMPLGGIGSNAVALGKAATDNGRGMLLGNPHFPWDGSERFYQSQLEIPGKIKVQGASLLGVPLINIGHTENLAWSHTVSTAYRFTPFEERLMPGSTTTYMRDGQPKQMTKDTVSVDVGGGKKATRTLYSTDHGPIFTSLLGLPLFPWTPASAYSMGDANADNFRYLNHFFETNRAQSADELLAILKRNQGIPWVNTIAADSKGQALYADISVVPAVPNAKRDDCVAGPLGLVVPALLGLPVLDGSRSECDWDVEPDALQKGIFGPNHLPSLMRDDYVTNSNDSYWLSNPAQPLEGFARIIGAERTARALRTRSGLVMVAEKLAGGGKFTSVKDLQKMLFDNRQHYGELVRDELVALCKANPMINGVDVSPACPVLERWDMRDNIESRGALLFRRFASRATTPPATGTGSLVEPLIFSTPFSASDPVNTPRGLNALSPLVRNALADAVTDLRTAGIPLDAPLGDFQFEMRGDERIPIHGGPGTVGLFNAINVGWNAQKGYPDVAHGTSFVQTVRFDGDRCPQSEALLTYSQSPNPESKHFADQTRAYSRKEWIPMRFCDSELKRDKGVKTTTLPHKAKAKKAKPKKRKARRRG